MHTDTQGHGYLLLRSIFLLQHLWGWILKLRLSLKRLKKRNKKVEKALLGATRRDLVGLGWS